MIRSVLLASVAALVFCVATPHARAADAPTPAEVRMRACLTAAAAAHRLPPAMLVILLKVEGGTLGRTSQNTNDTSDIGPTHASLRRRQVGTAVLTRPTIQRRSRRSVAGMVRPNQEIAPKNRVPVNAT